MNKLLIGISASAFLFGTLTTSAFATYSTPPSLNSAPNICWGHGAFGAFEGTAIPGEGSIIHYEYVAQDKAAGISLGSETGPANSSVCGNPQN